MVTNKEYKAMDEIRAQRRKQAQDRGIYRKAVKIAMRLGERAGKSHGTDYSYEDDVIHIWWDDYGHNMSINLLEPMDEQATTTYVFNVHLGEIEGYRPDFPDWEARIDKLYESLKPQMSAEDDRKRCEKRREFFKNWGVWPDP